MKPGGSILWATTALAVAACGTEQGKLEIRSTPVPASAVAKPVPYRIAEARGQLALGNVALALESFRKAWREDPDSVDALVGMAMSYDRMGRHDLSRRNFEMALAVAPGDVELLGAFAASLHAQGRTAEAAAVMGEVAARIASARSAKQPPPVVAEATPPVARVAPAPATVQSAAPAVSMARATGPQPPQRGEQAQAAAPAPLASRPAAAASGAMPFPHSQKPVATKPVVVAQAEAPAPAPVAAAAPAPAPSVTIKLPPPKPAEARLVQAAIAEPKQAAPPTAVRPAQVLPATAAAAAVPSPTSPPIERERPAQQAVHAAPLSKPAPAQPVRVAIAQERGPRLERLSMAEVALLTASGPIWRPTTVTRSDRSTTVRFVPLHQALARPVKVRLLNAARVDRLAARTRSWLAAKGWRGMSIGNARVARARSVVLYPQGHKALAQRLSAQFGFAIAPRRSGSQVIVLLGRDASRLNPLRRSQA